MPGHLFIFCIQIFAVLLNGSELFLSRQWEIFYNKILYLQF